MERKRISIRKRWIVATKTMTDVNNCYRAILAQVNQLDSIYRPKLIVKELYEDLTELAYYIMEDDDERIYKGVYQLHDTIGELDKMMAKGDPNEKIVSIIGELRTHLDYILINYRQHDKGQTLKVGDG